MPLSCRKCRALDSIPATKVHLRYSQQHSNEALSTSTTSLDTFDAMPPQPSLDGLGQVLAAVEVVTEDDTVGCDLVLACEWVMGATAGFEDGQCAFEPGVSSEKLEQDHVVG